MVDESNEPDPYADAEPVEKVEAPATITDDSQDNFVEAREPAELVMCVVLAAAYIGLARWCAELIETKYWPVVGFFITIGLLSLLLGLRPYTSPSALQLSRHGIKYRGPYWPQRKTVNWEQIERLYVSPELIFVLYHLPNEPKKVRLLLIHSVYMADRDEIPPAIAKYSPITPKLLANPGIITRMFQYGVFFLVVGWILYMMLW